MYMYIHTYAYILLYITFTGNILSLDTSIINITWAARVWSLVCVRERERKRERKRVNPSVRSVLIIPEYHMHMNCSVISHLSNFHIFVFECLPLCVHGCFDEWRYV